ncbi:MAG: hypothetical protein JWM31_2496 [Solirubrobacterales bacterium]|nr:hypothetical protein [Solirubrobacterales bacterium]
MTRTRRSRTLPVPPSAVWEYVGDPYSLPRWWPRVERVEQVTPGQFTEVLRSDRGRTMRADHRLTEIEDAARISWEQEVEGTPFARVMTYCATTVTLEAVPDGGTKVQLERRQQMRGMARLGGFMIRRATGRVLDGALEQLASQVAPAQPA